MKKLVLLALLTAISSLPFVKNVLNRLQAAQRDIQTPLLPDTTTKQSHIQVALLLDTSNSMDGLIEQAKSQLWKMVNELATAEKGGAAPQIEIALYQYGNSHLQANGGYIQRIVPLTADLDLVSEKLFELGTAGGDEYCGWVIQDATTDLEWSEQSDDLKVIIIAGNEPFTQGPVAVRQSCERAIQKGIMVNTIHCGDYQKGINEGWREGAELTDGQYLNIDQDDQVVHIPTPFDDEIIELNQQLNQTYIGYGAEGEAKAERQMVQDANAMSYGAANVRTRASVKANKVYNNATWDLVDATTENMEVLEEIEDEALPEEMREMNTAERAAFVENKRSERKDIQSQILELEKKAQAFEAAERAKNTDTQTLDNVLIGTVKQQAQAKSFQFKE
ncbi:MAG: vWA domain-containing protein [Bacteroidota bacterium]